MRSDSLACSVQELVELGDDLSPLGTLLPVFIAPRRKRQALRVPHIGEVFERSRQTFSPPQSNH